MMRLLLPLTALLVSILESSTWAAEPTERATRTWWSLQPLRIPPSASSIDSLISQKLAEKGLSLAPIADRATLIRRITYDLHGLPPTPEEVLDFQNDPRPDAWERLIDRLLASPRYGERWARYWLDLVRFADSDGFEYDKIRPNSWHYRDWVIRALNADMSYAEFVRMQLMGDLLGTRDGIAATGFLVAGPFDEVGNRAVSMLVRRRAREDELEDMLATISQTFLGMTLNCARCHDHKFDPLSMRDYYQTKAIFESVRGGERPLLSDPEQRQRQAEIAQLRQQIRQKEQKFAALEAELHQRVRQLLQLPTRTLPVLPISEWRFEGDARDSIGNLHGTLYGNAKIAKGRLILDGQRSFLQTVPLQRELREKTLEAWVLLPQLDQRGGGILTVERDNGAIFDAIVYGERIAGRWIAGSNSFSRTRDLLAPPEADAKTQLVHVAITYAADGTIRLFRNGTLYSDPYQPTGNADSTKLQVYPAGTSRVLIGLRHTGGGNGFLIGEVEEARLYDRALTAEQIEASYQAGVYKSLPVDWQKHLTAEEQQRFVQQERELRSLLDRERAMTNLIDVQKAYAATISAAGPTFLLRRGDIEKPVEQVSPASWAEFSFDSFRLPPDASDAQRRRRFADWITHPDNPLTWRVIVNRVWQYHFGEGLVRTPSDFGFNGDKPTHPELLDLLARDFRDSGGSLKQLHRKILLSHTYRQSSKANPKAIAIDADNRLLWRFPPRRLEAEAVRDTLLAISGELDARMGGLGYANSPLEPGEKNSKRRSIYRMIRHSIKDTLLDTFDCPDPSVRTPRRAITTTPLQALSLMNGAFTQQASEKLSQRIIREVGTDRSAQIHRAFWLTLQRSPSETEVARLLPLVEQHGLKELCWVLVNSTEMMTIR